MVLLQKNIIKNWNRFPVSLGNMAFPCTCVIDFAAPMTLGGLSCADPLKEEVKDWWEKKCGEIFGRLPNNGRLSCKSRFRRTSRTLCLTGGTYADGANMLARAVKPYGGTIIWRCFVYNCQQDWRDRRTDRALCRIRQLHASGRKSSMIMVIAPD